MYRDVVERYIQRVSDKTRMLHCIYYDLWVTSMLSTALQIQVQCTQDLYHHSLHIRKHVHPFLFPSVAVRPLIHAGLSCAYNCLVIGIYYTWPFERTVSIHLIEDKLYFHLSKGTLYLRCVEILQICLVEETLNNDLVEEAFYDCLIKDPTSNCLVEEVSSKYLVEAVFGDHLITETLDRLTEDNLEIRLFEDFHNRIFRGTI